MTFERMKNLLGGEPKYEDVQVTYFKSGAFSLKAESDGREVIYKSHELYI